MRYAVWFTKDGEDHLYSMAEDLYEAYYTWIRNHEASNPLDMWFDPVLKGEQPYPRFALYMEYSKVVVNFGNASKPIETLDDIALVGTYAQLDEAFRIKYENEDEDSRWELWVEELV